MEVLTDRPTERFVVGARLHPEGSASPLTIVEARPANPGWILRFGEVRTREAADGLRLVYLEVEAGPADALPRLYLTVLMNKLRQFTPQIMAFVWHATGTLCLSLLFAYLISLDTARLLEGERRRVAELEEAQVGALDVVMNNAGLGTSKRIVEMVWEDLKPGDVLNAKSFDNAITTVLALGGSVKPAVGAVDYQGDTLVATDGPRLVIVSLADPASPLSATVLGSLNVGGRVKDPLLSQ